MDIIYTSLCCTVNYGFDVKILWLSYTLIEVLHGSENVTSRTGNTPSCRATAGEKCTETVGSWSSLPRAQQKGTVIVLSVGRSVCLSVCLSVPSQDFEQNRLVYRLYLLRMSQKLY